MKLLLRRDQRSGMTGKIIFTLTVRADLATTERDAINKYKLGDTMLYARERLHLEDDSLKSVAKFWLKHALNLTVQVKDLVNGKSVECKDILEMMAAEEQLKEAARVFGVILRSAMYFGGEEVIEV